MVAPELLYAVKLSTSVLAVLALVAKIKKVAGFNRGQNEYIPLKILRTYSSMEIEGSYTANRKKVLRYSNTMTVVFYFSVVLVCLAFLYPIIARKLGLS